jgi:predicted nucleotidyltransferase
MDFRWRQTGDLDLSLAVSLGDVASGMGSLTGWRRSQTAEHEWLSPAGARVDIVPASRDLLIAREVAWPLSGRRMNLTGMRLAFERAITRELLPGLSIQIAPVVVLALLKIVSYQDRPHERDRDLEDLAHIFEGYLAPDDERRFADLVLEAGVEFSEASAFTLGHDLAALVDEGEMALIASWRRRVRDDHEPWHTQARMARLGPTSWDREPEALLRRVEAFEKGLATQPD